MERLFRADRIAPLWPCFSAKSIATFSGLKKPKEAEMTRRRFAVTMLGFSGIAIAGAVFPLGYRAGMLGQDDDKKEKKTEGTDKNTGGEAPGDREKVQDIKEGAEKLKEKKEKEHAEREKEKPKKDN